jgi:hypothetical protein
VIPGVAHPPSPVDRLGTIEQSSGRELVAIYRMLEDMAFNVEAVKTMTAAYEALLIELGLTDRNDPCTEIVASKIIAIYQMGEHAYERICERALREIRG